jgi:hypothetical protein
VVPLFLYILCEVFEYISSFCQLPDSSLHFITSSSFWHYPVGRFPLDLIEMGRQGGGYDHIWMLLNLVELLWPDDIRKVKLLCCCKSKFICSGFPKNIQLRVK